MNTSNVISFSTSHFIKKELLRIVKNKKEIDNFDFDVLHTSDLIFGSYTTNIGFLLAPILRRSPKEIILDIKNNFSKEFNNFFDSIIITDGGYLNFKLSNKYLKSVIKNTNEYKFINSFDLINKEEKYIVEFSSPDITKPFTIAYMRSTLVGDSVANILKNIGLNVVKDNRIGDWGMPFGVLIAGVDELTNTDRKNIVTKNKYQDLVSLQRRFLKKKKENEDFNQKASAVYKKMESGDKDTIMLWKDLVSVLLGEVKEVYRLFNIKFDVFTHESICFKNSEKVIKLLEKSDFIYRNNSLLVALFEDGKTLSPLVLRKENGSILYPVREIGGNLICKEKYGDNICILNEVGEDQSEYLKRLYKVEDRLGIFKKEQREHISHGLYSIRGFKMNSGIDIIPTALDVVKLVEKKLKIIDFNKKYRKKISIFMIKYFDLSHKRQNEIEFSIDSITFSGKNSFLSLFLIYKNLISNIKKQNILDKTFNEHNRRLAEILEKSSYVLSKAAKEREPHIISLYLSEILYEYDNGVRLGVENSDDCIRAVKSIVIFYFDILGIQIQEVI